jgi:predicted adenylyl cyclase CyaB
MKQGAEIEAKYRLTPGQRTAIEGRLGKPARILRQRDVYFDVPDRVLRLREENGQTFITRKDASTVTPDGIKSRHEVETPFPAEAVPVLEDLLPWLGHRRLIEVCKERHEYDLDGFALCLDRIEGLAPGDFAEIESAGGSLDELRALRDELGLAETQAETRSYARMVAEATHAAGTEAGATGVE